MCEHVLVLIPGQDDVEVMLVCAGRVTRQEERSQEAPVQSPAHSRDSSGIRSELENLQGWRHLSVLGQLECLCGRKDFLYIQSEPVLF